MAIGVSLGVMGWQSQASAVDTIRLRYNSAETTVSLAELAQFAQTGNVPPQLQSFFQASQQVPQSVSRLLTAQVRVPENFRPQFLTSSTGEFVLIQLDKLIQSSGGVTALRTAVEQSIADDRNVSLLELLERYPESTVTVDLTDLSRTYDQVSAFVERILPALEVAKEYLRDLICTCPRPNSAAPAPNSGSSPRSSLSGATAVAATCPGATSAALPTATPALPVASGQAVSRPAVSPTATP